MSAAGPRGPAFLGIGAQKAATTWLDRCLRRHPSIWLPPIKELHYFDELHAGAPRPLFRRSWAGRRLRRHLVPRLRADARGLDPAGLAWDARYFFGRRDDGWYLSLFPDGRARVSGEITPDYSALDERTVARVRTLLPEVKPVFLMRDPIDRSWSQIRMDLAREGRRAGDVPIGDLIERARSARVARRSDYDRTLRIWGSHFAEDRIFVGFVEDVQARPEAVLGSLFRFLEVGADAVDSGLARRRVHAGEDVPPPPALEREIARVHVEGLRAVARRFGGHASGWLARAERVLAA